jgi:nicotinamide riboside transporter PnuC
MGYWSYLLAAIGVTGIFFVGRKTIWGWLVLCVNECIWIAYAIATKQYGFIIMALAYTAVYIKSYMGWKSESESETPQPPKAAEYQLDELW